MLIMFNLATKVQNATRVVIKGGFFARVVVRVSAWTDRNVFGPKNTLA